MNRGRGISALALLAGAGLMAGEGFVDIFEPPARALVDSDTRRRAHRTSAQKKKRDQRRARKKSRGY